MGPIELVNISFLDKKYCSNTPPCFGYNTRSRAPTPGKKKNQFRFLGNCPPISTPSLNHHFSLSEKEVLILVYGRGWWAVSQKPKLVQKKKKKTVVKFNRIPWQTGNIKVTFNLCLQLCIYFPQSFLVSHEDQSLASNIRYRASSLSAPRIVP